MNWITNYVRPKIQALVGRPSQPDNLWERCPNCGQMLFRRELEANLRVCTHCGHHLRMGAIGRLDMLFDDAEYTRIELPDVPADPLKFRDRRRYVDRMRENQAKTGRDDALVVAHGNMGGMPVVAAVFDFDFMGGSMGVAVGEAFVAAGRLAKLQEAPLIALPASGGARMQEGILSLMQRPRTFIARNDVKEAGLPYSVVLSDPTTGGVTASFAMLGDIAIAEPGAIIGFAGARVIEETIREKLPDGFQRAEYLLEHGIVDMVVPRPELRDTLVRIIDMVRNPKPAIEITPLPVARPEGPEPANDPEPAAEN